MISQEIKKHEVKVFYSFLLGLEDKCMNYHIFQIVEKITKYQTKLTNQNIRTYFCKSFARIRF